MKTPKLASRPPDNLPYVNFTYFESGKISKERVVWLRLSKLSDDTLKGYEYVNLGSCNADCETGWLLKTFVRKWVNEEICIISFND